MIISMPTIARSQRRYDHRLRNLVQSTGDLTVATDLGVPRSTARGWLGETATVVVCLDVMELTEPELRQEVVKLRRRVRKLIAIACFRIRRFRDRRLTRCTSAPGMRWPQTYSHVRPPRSDTC